MDRLAEVFVPIAFFAAIVLIVYFTARYSHQTKKAILEKGGNIEITKKKFPFLEIGLTLLGVGLGLAIAALPQSFDISTDVQGLLIAACILLFGGAGLVSAFFIRRKLEKQ